MLARAPSTWVEIAVLCVVGDEDLVEGKLSLALEVQRLVADRVAGHLQLLADSSFRTPWLAARLLSTDKEAARSAAVILANHLASTPPPNRTHFEKYLFDNEGLWQDLTCFSKANPAVLLWHDSGKYKRLFEFLAPRFLLAPDSVLDAERVHARWQWECATKRSIKMHSLNASLRLSHYHENNYAFPTSEELLEHLQAEIAEHRVSLEDIARDKDIATGWRLLNMHAASKSRLMCLLCMKGR